MGSLRVLLLARKNCSRLVRQGSEREEVDYPAVPGHPGQGLFIREPPVRVAVPCRGGKMIYFVSTDTPEQVRPCDLGPALHTYDPFGGGSRS